MFHPHQSVPFAWHVIHFRLLLSLISFASGLKPWLWGALRWLWGALTFLFFPQLYLMWKSKQLSLGWSWHLPTVLPLPLPCKSPVCSKEWGALRFFFFSNCCSFLLHSSLRLYLHPRNHSWIREIKCPIPLSRNSQVVLFSSFTAVSFFWVLSLCFLLAVYFNSSLEFEVLGPVSAISNYLSSLQLILTPRDFRS